MFSQLVDQTNYQFICRPFFIPLLDQRLIPPPPADVTILHHPGQCRLVKHGGELKRKPVQILLADHDSRGWESN